eukprot:593787-Rhodomonas_salina.1
MAGNETVTRMLGIIASNPPAPPAHTKPFSTVHCELQPSPSSPSSRPASPTSHSSMPAARIPSPHLLPPSNARFQSRRELRACASMSRQGFKLSAQLGG